MSTDKRLKRILVTNDDGIDAGLAVAVGVLSCSLKRCGYQRRWWTALDAQKFVVVSAAASMNEGIVASR